MRKIWMAMKLFHVPITHEYIQNLTDFDLEFIDLSTALDDPRVFEKLQNTFYDDDFDEYADEAEDDELTEEEKAMMEEIMKKNSKENENQTDDFTPVENMKEDTTNFDNPDDWEEVE